MKTFVRHAVLFGQSLQCARRGSRWPRISTGFPMAASRRPWSADREASRRRSRRLAPPCGQTSCCEERASRAASLGCERCPACGIVGFVGFDSFKGVSDRRSAEQFRRRHRLNAAVLLPGTGRLRHRLAARHELRRLRLGRPSLRPSAAAQSQQQIFVTTGFFRKADEDHRLSFGVVYDWMVNNNWGVYATAPTLGQWRGQVEYAFSDCNAVGVYGCVRDRQRRTTTADPAISSR